MVGDMLPVGLLGEYNAAFIAFICSKAKPYKGMANEWGSLSESEVSQLLMSFRSDNCLGFFGGKVEEGESLKDAAVREVYEEAGIELLPQELSQLDTVKFTHEVSEDLNSHLFIVEVSMERLRELQKHSYAGKHFYAESGGAIIVHIHKNNWRNLLNSSLAKTVKEELMGMFLDNYFVTTLEEF